MKKLTQEQLEAIELCQLQEKGECWECPARFVDCLKDPATTALLLLEEIRVMKKQLKNG